MKSVHTGELMLESRTLHCVACDWPIILRAGATVPKCPACERTEFACKTNHEDKKDVSSRKSSDRL
jgi:uncharacterized Zn finger protein (UPF0148 family)